MSTIYKPSLLCRVIGHKFFSVQRKVRPKVRAADVYEKTIIDETFTPLSHCARCGIDSPFK